MTLTDAQVARLRRQVGAPDKAVWNTFECGRCTRPFKVQGFADLCPPCNAAEEKHGQTPILGGFSGC